MQDATKLGGDRMVEVEALGPQVERTPDDVLSKASEVSSVSQTTLTLKQL